MKRYSRIKMTLLLALMLCAWGGETFSEVPADFIAESNAAIEVIRKRDGVIQITNGVNPLPGVEVTIKQIRSHFGFGAAIGYPGIKEHGDKYWEAFEKYFEWATPENEMKWNYIDELDDFQFWGEADSIVKWCHERDVKVRGHNLFWNERLEFQPEWALDLPPAEFKQAMKNRIESAMTHFNGKVEHWDIVNEIIHQAGAVLPEKGFLEQLTEDPDIYTWIFKEARAIDSTAKFCVNEYYIASAGDTHFMQYCDRILQFVAGGAGIDIVGVEGHLYNPVVYDDFRAKLQYIAGTVNLPIWLTEVDFTVPVEERADRMEEIMRVAYSEPFMGGIVLWVWWDGRKWKETLTSVVVDSNFVETDMGARWRAVRDEWKTNVTVTTDAEGKASFRGFHGKYVVSVNSDDAIGTDTIYLEPGTEAQLFNMPVGISEKRTPTRGTKLLCNGREINICLPELENKQLYIYRYSLAGKLLAKIPVQVINGIGILPKMTSSGCYINRIGFKDRALHTMMDINLR